MFNVVYLVSAGEPGRKSTEILISEAYRWAFSRGNRYGYAAAYAVLIIFGVLLMYSRGCQPASPAAGCSDGGGSPSVGAAWCSCTRDLALVLITIATLYPILWVVRLALSPGQAMAIDRVAVVRSSRRSPSTTSVDCDRHVRTRAARCSGAWLPFPWLFFRQLFNSLFIWRSPPPRSAWSCRHDRRLRHVEVERFLAEKSGMGSVSRHADVPRRGDARSRCTSSSTRSGCWITR